MRLLDLLVLATGISALNVPRQGNSDCAQWCAAHFSNPGAVCTSLAAKGTGPCFECGPAAPQPPMKILCNEKCVPSDNQNCGKCGNVCDSFGSTCLSGKCNNPYGCSPPDTCTTYSTRITASSCGPLGQCLCGPHATDSRGVCFQNFAICPLNACSSDAQCGKDSFCLAGSCCGYNVCAVASTACGGIPA